MLENAYGICIEPSQRKLSENINGSNDIHTSQLAARLLIHVISEDVNNLTEKVGWILNHYSAARDSDITCQIKYWERYEPKAINDGLVFDSKAYKKRFFGSKEIIIGPLNQAFVI